MAHIKIIKEYKINDYDEFCKCFSLQQSENAGDNFTDEELIIKELHNLDGKYILNFIDNDQDGYFLIQEI
jgi:hypothetical protein